MADSSPISRNRGPLLHVPARHWQAITRSSPERRHYHLRLDSVWPISHSRINLASLALGGGALRYLGVNKGWTCSGKMLRNGGAAAFLDGKLVALSEERITGKK